MKIKRSFFQSFQTKVTLIFVFSLLLLAGLATFLLYEYSLHSQFNQLKEKLTLIAATTATFIDSDALMGIPLNRDGVNNEEYKKISLQLNRIKQANPDLKYIYTMSKTESPGIWQFLVDPDPAAAKANPHGPTAFPGDRYDASRFPKMLAAYNGPTVDDKLNVDEWGVTLSGYAPIYGRQMEPVAVLGVDVDASRVYAIENTVRLRALSLFLIGIFLSLILASLVSKGVTGPVEKLVEGTRKIAAGDLEYKVKIKGRDEISELANEFNGMASSLLDSRNRLNEYFYRVVQSMIRSLEAKDHYTRGHSDRVSEYSGEIALKMGFPEEKVNLLKKAAQLHDIGKLGIHEDILNKKGTLSENEWDVVHKHPEVGEEILKPVFLDDEMLPVIRSHHERWDGKGYPDGLQKEQINVFAQIVSVADAYDAMTSSRAYRTALTKEEAVGRLKQSAGQQFNPEIIKAFIEVLESS